MPTRMEVLGDSIAQFPSLIKKIEGPARMGNPTWKYRLRKVNVEEMDDIMNNLSGDVGISAVDVFGRWALWPSSWSEKRAKLEEDVTCHVNEEWAAVDLVANETVDVDSPQRYAARGEDRRRSQLIAFLYRHVSTGEAISGGLSCVEQRYAKKIARGEAIGRRYSIWGISAELNPRG